MGNGKPESKDEISWTSKKWKITISRLITNLVAWLNSLDDRFTHHAYNPNDNGLEDLTATSDADKEQVYESFILWGIRNPNTRNIAITGPYGSGKSSIIKTFQKKHKEFKYLNISLAKFDERYKENEDWRNDVELSILQQFFYHVKNKKLPDSRFKKINKTTTWQMLFATLCWLLWGVSFLLIYQPEFFQRFSWWEEFRKTNIDWLYYISCGILIIGIAYGFYKLFRVFKNIRFSKLGVMSGEMELADKNDASIFNKHLDEIIYFFEVCRFDVVVIEDLDRIKDPEIFTKLREINYLINNSNQIGRKVKFLYATKDDLFHDESRTKFFDLIIPVIPIINTSNSADKLIEKLASAIKDKKFIQAVSLYLDDMRTLINVVNEFKLYGKLIGEKLNKEKMLAIIIYKNLYPTEFEELHKSKGEISEVFKTKKNFVQQEIERINSEIKELRKAIKKYEQIHVKSLEELRSVYLMKIFEQIPSQHYVSDNRRPIPWSDVNNDAFLSQVIQTSNLPVQYHVNNVRQNKNISIDFSSIERDINPDYTYEERKQQMKFINDNEITKAKKQVDELTGLKNKIEKSTLKEIIASNESFKFPQELEDKILLAYLVRNGHIDESYPTYISHFYEGSMTQKDREFVLSIMNQQPLEIDAPIDNFELVAERIYFHDYSQPAILNLSYFDWLTKSEYERKSELSEIISQLTNKSERSLKFIDSCMEKKELRASLIPNICEKWPDFWDFLVTDSQYEHDKLDKYLVEIIRYCPIGIIKSMNKNEQIVRYIFENKNFFDTVGLSDIQNKLSEVIDGLSIKFRWLQYHEELEELFNHIYENDSYEINAANIKLITQQKGKEDIPKPQLDTANYTAIMALGPEKLKGYIGNNLGNYIETVLLPSDTNTKEPEDTIISLLNNEHLSVELKERVIEKQEQRISDIKSVPTTVWDTLLQSNKLVSSWQNLLAYYRETASVTESASDFLNDMDNMEKLTANEASKLLVGDDQEAMKELIKSLFECDALNIDSYKYLTDTLGGSYEALAIETLAADKVHHLILKGLLSFSAENFEKVNKDFPTELASFVERHMDEFLKIEPPLSLPEFAFDSVLRSSRVTMEQKISLVKRLDTESLNESKQISESLLDFLLANQSVLNEIETSVILNLLNQQQDLEKCLILLIRSFALLNTEQKNKGLSSLGSEYSELIANGKKQVKISYTKLNEELLKELEKNEMISSFGEKKGDWVVYFKRS